MYELTQEILRARGFLSPEPIIDARVPFDRISILAGQLPELIASGTSTLRKEIRSLPILDISDVSDSLVQRALLRDYHYLQSAYVRAQPEARTVPASIAVPSYALARHLGRRPMLSYASVVLDNWRQPESGMPFTFEQVLPIRTFTNTKDERGFLVPHVLMEYEARDAIDQVDQLRREVRDKRVRAIIPRHLIIADAFATMQTLFACITKHCDPKAYFEEVRPWMDGFKEVVFGGVDEMGGAPQSFIGPSGAQSSILPVIDAILCIRHDRDSFSAYLEKLREYMPPEHVRLIKQAEEACPLREFVRQQGDPDLLEAYRASVKSVHSFRLVHTAFTKRYISARSTTARGTGGSMFEEFLGKYAADTEAALL